jgi:hypothetical protein
MRGTFNARAIVAKERTASKEVVVRIRKAAYDERQNLQTEALQIRTYR